MVFPSLTRYTSAAAGDSNLNLKISPLHLGTRLIYTVQSILGAPGEAES